MTATASARVRVARPAGSRRVEPFTVVSIVGVSLFAVFSLCRSG
jgi:hypothetical protein